MHPTDLLHCTARTTNLILHENDSAADIQIVSHKRCLRRPLALLTRPLKCEGLTTENQLGATVSAFSSSQSKGCGLMIAHAYFGFEEKSKSQLVPKKNSPGQAEERRRPEVEYTPENSGWTETKDENRTGQPTNMCGIQAPLTTTYLSFSIFRARVIHSPVRSGTPPSEFTRDL